MLKQYVRHRGDDFSRKVLGLPSVQTLQVIHLVAWCAVRFKEQMIGLFLHVIRYMAEKAIFTVDWQWQ